MSTVPALKPQDVFVASYLAVAERAGRSCPTHAQLGEALHVSPSTVFGSLKNLRRAKLTESADPGSRVAAQRFLSFLVYGVPAIYFPTKVGVVRGIATSVFSPAFRDRFTKASDVPCVWPYSRGREEGDGLLPLYPSVPAACSRDPALYQIMAAIDVLRSGRARERGAAAAYLEDFLGISASGLGDRASLVEGDL
jgi:hypothetical protein